MCSVPGVPIPGSKGSVVIARVGINQSCGLVELWVNMNNEIKQVYEQMQEEIQLPDRNFCESEGKTGDLCLVNVDDRWHRARIVSMQEKYEVFLIDRAQPHSTTADALAWGKDECFILPPEIESCVLANVLSIDNNWPERAANFLKSLPGKEFEGLVQHVLMPDRTILLDVPMISKHLCKEGVAKKIPVDEFKNLVLKCLNLPEEDVIEPMTTEQGLNGCNQLENGDHYFYPEPSSNTFEPVIVTEVIDAQNIFCQLVIFSNSIKIVTEQMNEEGKDKSGVEDSQLQNVGMPCAAKGLDGKWRRATLKQEMSSNDASVSVFFVDEGKHELIQATNVKKLDHKFLRMPVVTYHCSLEGVKGDKEWTRDEIDRLKSLILNQNIVARFERHNLLAGSYSVSLYTPNAACINDFFLKKKDLNINADAKQKCTPKLILNGGASPSIFPKSFDQSSFTQHYDSPFSPMETPLCDLLTVGSSVGVKISCIDSASKFWCQTTQCDQKLDVLMKDLQAHYASVHPKPLVDSICVARNPDNNMWYRAKIIPNQLSPDVEVRFIDYGQTKMVPLQELRPIDPTFLRLDAQAFQCSLFSLPPSDVNYTNEEFHKFVDSCLAQNGELKCVIKAVATDKEGMLLNMVDLQTQSESAAQVLTEKLATKPEAYNQSSDNIVVNSNEKIRITYSETVHSFYGQLDRNSIFFQQVQNDIQNLVTHSVHSECPLAPNSLCIARYCDSNWYRGQVLETSPDFKVYFVDLGKVLALNRADIRPFPQEASAARTIPVLAIPMGLYNIPDEILQNINDWFTQKVVGYSFTVSVIEKGQNGKLMVELFDGSKSLNAQVREKIINHHQVENKHLCNGSKISPLSNMEIDICQPDMTQQNGPQNLQHNQNEGNDMDDWILVDVEPQNGNVVKESPEEIFETITEQTNAMEVDHGSKASQPNQGASSPEKILSKCMYKKPILSLNKTQELYASSISSPDFFWCQCSNTEDLDKVTRLAQMEGKVAQDPFFPLKLLTGHPCLALYRSDNQWYRAQVIKKNNKTFSVVFIDYGNEEDVDYKDVRPVSTSLLEMAPQAFLCSLDDIEALDYKLDDAFSDKFYSILVDKPLNVRVLRMQQNSEIQLPQYSVQIDDAGLNKLLQKYGISNCRDALDKSPKRDLKLFNKPNVLVNTTVKVYASSISSPAYFWCQHTDAGDLDQITKLAQKCCWVDDPNFPQTLTPGSPCLALYSDDNKWCRAQVISREKGKFNVVFIDYGNEEEVNIFNVRPLPPNLMEKPPQAFLCRLENFDENNTTWDDTLYDAFYKQLLDKIIKVKIISVEHNEEVKVPQYTVQFDFDIEKFCRTYVSSFRTSIPQTVAQNNAAAKAPDINWKTCKYNKPQLVMNKTVMAYASSIPGPEYFWCQYQDSAELDKINKLAQIEGKTLHDPNFANDLIPGSPCLALFSDENMWYRAQIRSKSQDKFSVLFIDYGNEADIIVENVRPMSLRLLEAVPQGFLCCLEGFDFTKGAWDDKTDDHFYTLLVDNLLQVTPSCTVEDQETKLPQFVVQVQCGKMAVNNAMQKYWKPNGNIDDISSNLEQNLSIKRKAFKKPNVSQIGIEEVYASSIDSPHYFWCQFDPDLDKISKLVQDAAQTQQRPNALEKGDICLALFPSDNLWYRAMVSKKTGEKFIMVFIDYGNEAEVTLKDTRLLPQNLLEQPPQAFLCSLYGYDQTKGTWDDQGLDDFFDSLVEKPLKVKICTEEENQELALPQYSVQIECEGVDMNKLMEKHWRGAADPSPKSSFLGRLLGF